MYKKYLLFIIKPQFSIIIALVLVATAFLGDLFSVSLDSDNFARSGFLFFGLGVLLALANTFFENNKNVVKLVKQTFQVVVVKVRKRFFS